jgi:hypothetical protein
MKRQIKNDYELSVLMGDSLVASMLSLKAKKAQQVNIHGI